MSRPAPNPKQQFLQTTLLMIAIFFGMQIFLKPQNNEVTYEGKVIATRAEAYSALVTANQKGLDVTIAQKLLPQYNHLVDQDLSAKKISEAEAEELKLQGVVLVADTQLRQGQEVGETARVRLAYNTVASYERKLLGKPQWTTKLYTVTDHRNFKTGQITGQGLHDQIVATLTELNKSDLVWGFIPYGYQLIDSLVGLTGRMPGFSYAFAAFLLALAVRSIVFPLSQRQLMFSRQMSQLTPRIQEIKAQFPDQAAQNAKTMELYSEYGLNPFSGCLPAFIQMPLFLTVYQCMLHYQFEFQKGYFLWINPETNKSSHGFFAANLGQQDYVLIVIYGITMVISTLLTPVTDPTQQKQQRIMGVSMALLFTVMMFLGLFPVVSGFVLYWTFTNLLATAQSLRAYRMPLPPLVKVNAPGGGVYPSKPKGKWAQMFEDAQRMAAEQGKPQTGDDAKNTGKWNKPNDEDGGSASTKPTKKV